MSDAFQVLEDCPNCRVEGAVVGLVDPLEAQGVTVVSTCRLCGRKEMQGAVKRAGRSFQTVGQVLRSMETWAANEGTPDLEEFCAANMCGLGPAEVAMQVLKGQKVHTSFDVVAFLFPGMGGGMGADPDADPGSAFDPYEPARSLDGLPFGWPDQEPEPVDELPIGWPEPDDLPGGWPVVPRSPGSLPTTPPAPGRTPVRALAAVVLADGIARPGELHFLDRFCQRGGYPPAGPEDMRPWRPNELARPDDPEAVLDAMIALAHVDEEQDGSEWRVVREFARSWAFPLDELERRGERAQRETAPAMRRLFGALERLFIRTPRRGPGAA